MKNLIPIFTVILITSLVVCGCKKDNDPIIGSTFTDPRDGQVYAIVKIGKQFWFAENLNFATGSSWCYENDMANCNTYGRLYDWFTASNACPTGWRLPSYEDMSELINYLGEESTAGGKLKSVSGWKAPNTDASNSSGFSGIPGGFRSSLDPFLGIGESGSWWSSSDGRIGDAWYLYLNYDSGIAGRSLANTYSGLSCRCLKN